MGLELETVIPWGRCLDEYQRMFNLSFDDLQFNILDVAGGPASFNQEMTEKGYQVISCDPIYQFTPEEIEQRIKVCYPQVIAGLKANLQDYLWEHFTSPEQLGESRTKTMQKFLQDFSQGMEENRYITATLPTLPFSSHQFDLVLCSHFLLTYSQHFSQKFHQDSILELCRVGKEVRIFPLLTISGQVSPFLESLIESLRKKGYFPQIQRVNYEFQKGGNQMLKITSCDGVI